jgi:hypothetical protein
VNPLFLLLAIELGWLLRALAFSILGYYYFLPAFIAGSTILNNIRAVGSKT